MNVENVSIPSGPMIAHLLCVPGRSTTCRVLASSASAPRICVSSPRITSAMPSSSRHIRPGTIASAVPGTRVNPCRDGAEIGGTSAIRRLDPALAAADHAAGDQGHAFGNARRHTASGAPARIHHWPRAARRAARCARRGCGPDDPSRRRGSSSCPNRWQARRCPAWREVSSAAWRMSSDRGDWTRRTRSESHSRTEPASGSSRRSARMPRRREASTCIYQRAAASSSLARASTQRSPSGVSSFFQNGAWVFR